MRRKEAQAGVEGGRDRVWDMDRQGMAGIEACARRAILACEGRWEGQIVAGGGLREGREQAVVWSRVESKHQVPKAVRRRSWG